VLDLINELQVHTYSAVRRHCQVQAQCLPACTQQVQQAHPHHISSRRPPTCSFSNNHRTSSPYVFTTLAVTRISNRLDRFSKAGDWITRLITGETTTTSIQTYIRIIYSNDVETYHHTVILVWAKEYGWEVDSVHCKARCGCEVAES
jgi:hypothetical protein